MGTVLVVGALLALVALSGRKKGGGGSAAQSALQRRLVDAVNWTYSGASVPEQLDAMIAALEMCDGRDYGIALEDVAQAVIERMPDEPDPGPVDPNTMAHVSGLDIADQIAMVGELWAAGYYDSAGALMGVVQTRLNREYEPCRKAA